MTPTPDDNSQSVGSVVTYGRFRALDLGDLLWNNERDLVCPRNLHRHGRSLSSSRTTGSTVRARRCSCTPCGRASP